MTEPKKKKDGDSLGRNNYGRRRKTSHKMKAGRLEEKVKKYQRDQNRSDRGRKIRGHLNPIKFRASQA